MILYFYRNIKFIILITSYLHLCFVERTEQIYHLFIINIRFIATIRNQY